MRKRLKKLIRDKTKQIEEKTGNVIGINEDNSLNVGACIDFPGWEATDRTGLPKILYKKGIHPIHIFHELIHLENFFVDQYSLIATNDPNLHSVLDKFKNIPEDYVAHKTISDDYGLNPIDINWFPGKDDLGRPDDIIAADLVNFYAFSEFCPAYRNLFERFEQECKQRNREAYSMAERAIQALDGMDYTKKASYDECAEEMIRIFAWNYYDEGKIYISFLSKENAKWRWNR